MKPAHIHLRIHHWVVWWFCLGVIFGAIALVNIFFRDLTRAQERGILVVGVINWVLGGLVCWAFEGIKVQKPPQTPEQHERTATGSEREWHSASEFVLPGSAKRLPPNFPARGHPHSPGEHHDKG